MPTRTRDVAGVAAEEGAVAAEGADEGAVTAETGGTQAKDVRDAREEEGRRETGAREERKETLRLVAEGTTGRKEATGRRVG